MRSRLGVDVYARTGRTYAAGKALEEAARASRPTRNVGRAVVAVAAGASGFITARSTLGADLSLIASVLAVALLTAGVVLARRRRYHAHRWTQSGGVVLNAIPVFLWMAVSLTRYILPGLPTTLSEHGHLLAAVHATVGACGVALGLFLLVRGNQLMANDVSLRRYRTPMRVAYLLYVSGVALGVALYVVTYG